MLAISIRQPWASLILRAGKDIENRTWPTKVRGRVLVHAAKGMTRDEWEDAIEFAVEAIKSNPPKEVKRIVTLRELGFDFEALQRGGIIGSVEIVDCVRQTESPWFVGAMALYCAIQKFCRSPHGKASSDSSTFHGHHKGAHMPERIQLQRSKGWRMPENTFKVDRTTKWGNPFVPGKPVPVGPMRGQMVTDKRHAYVLYRSFAPLNPGLIAAARAELAGKNLACWCSKDDPYEDACHAAVLLELANSV